MVDDMERADLAVFGLKTISDYLRFCDISVDRFNQEPSNICFCFSALLSLNHIPDWLRYKLSVEKRRYLGLNEKVGEAVKRHFEDQNNDLVILRETSNGIKHLRLDKETKVVGYGYAYGYAYGRGGFLVDDVPVNELCTRILDYWHQLLDSAQIEK